MRVTCLGARGSTPAPGPDFHGVGGHTSCLALGRRDAPASLVLDAGTGIRALGAALGGRPFDGAILLTHLHWDHLIGLPFSPAATDGGSRTRLMLPAGGDPEAVLARMFAPPFFPVGITGLAGAWSVEAIPGGHFDAGGFHVLARPVPHGGGITYGFRVEVDGASLAYLPDHDPGPRRPPAEGWAAAARELAEGVDLLVHDAHWRAAEIAGAPAHGHASAEAAVAIARAAGARRLWLFHHHPERTDAEVAATVADLTGDRLEVAAAREGASLTLP